MNISLSHSSEVILCLKRLSLLRIVFICYSLLIKKWTRPTTLEIVIPMFYPSVSPVPINVPLLTGACSIFNRFVFIVSIVLSLYRLCTLSCTFFMHVCCVNSIKYEYEYQYLKWYRYHSRAWVRFLIYPVVTMALACIVSEIKRDVGQKSRFLYTCIRRLRWGSLSEYYHGLPLGLEKIEWCELKSGRIVSESQSSQTMAVASSGDVVN